MLTELSIRDFTIIDDVSITFQEGLTVLTGETGAGKSIIIDAVQLLAGGRGSVDFVRHGSDKAELEGLFTIDGEHAAHQVAQEYGVKIEDDGMIVLERVITGSGKSICRVNGKLVTLAILKQFGRTLIDIHSQHETQSLMNRDNHLYLLDLYAAEDIHPSKKAYADLHKEMLALEKRYKDLSENEQEMAHRLDLLQFQKKELEQAELVPDEDDSLEEELRTLSNYEKIYNGLQDAHNALYGEMKGIDYLNQAQQALQDAKEYDPFIAEKAEELTNHYYLLEELAFDVSDKIDSLSFDAERLNDIQSRLSEINRLKKKYGSSVNEMLSYLGEIDEEIETLTDKDSHLASLEKEIDSVRKDAELEAKQLHDIRRQAARSLETELHRELENLYLDKASFEVSFTSDKSRNGNLRLHKNGFDQVQFQISTNAGEPLKSLEKVASGGELSRIMLALKTLFAKHQGVTSVIFDEVDTGVSGRVAQSIAEKIHTISTGSQVLCITHLPQVAAMADIHKLITKTETDEHTETKVMELSTQKQIEEISRMITGRELTETAKEHAEELLRFAEELK